MKTHLPLTLLCWSIASTGCLRDAPSLRPSDAGAPYDAGSDARVMTRVERLELADADGTVRRPWDLARRPTIGLWTSRPIADDEETVLLLAGPPDEGLLADLQSAPLRQDTLARAISCERVRAGGLLQLVPRDALARGGRYTLAVARWAADVEAVPLDLDARSFVASLSVRDDPRAGAVALESWPPDGAQGVTPRLPFVAVRFDGEVRDGPDGLVLRAEGGPPRAGPARALDCAEVGWPSGYCVALAPTHLLVPGVTHEIDVVEAVHDGAGASVPAWRATFDVARDSTPRPLSLLEPTCAIDEEPTAAGCVLADDRSVTLTTRFDAPARVFLATPGAADSAVAPRGDAALRLGRLGPSRELHVFLQAVGLGGDELARELLLRTTEPLATLSITEVRANPRGAEPRQEYVEVWNWGPSAIDLAGFALADSPTSAGDRIASHVDVPAGARVLLVADAFDPEDDTDDPVPPGVALVRIGTSLATAGVANSGEALYLRDPEGRRVSAAPAAPIAPTGACVVRATDDPRDGRVGTFVVDALGCTPGRPDRVTPPP